MKLENIFIVMVGTTHPGNIGAAARAMKNMDLQNLVLVNPSCPVGEIAYARASGANAVLDNRVTAKSLEAAVAHCNVVIGSTARSRSLSWPELTPDEMNRQIWSLDDNSSVAIVFGREHSGLTNEELQLCNFMVCIPTNPDFSSLNVASAIQVLCYEVFKSSHQAVTASKNSSDEPLATSFDIDGYITHLEQVLIKTEFLDLDNPGQLMARLRRLYQRVNLSKIEVNILRGILNSVAKFKP